MDVLGNAGGWGDCRGVLVPSAFEAVVAASKESSFRIGGSATKAVPFD